MKKIISLTLAIVTIALCLSCFASCGKKTIAIGVQAGTTGEAFVKGDNGDPNGFGYEGFANVETVPATTAALAVADMIAGNVQYVVVDASVGKALAETETNKGKIKVVDFALTKEDLGFAIDKNQPDLKATINQFLADNKQAIADLYTKYADINEDNQATWTGNTVEAGTYDANKSQFVIATNAEWAPYEFKVGNKFAGIEIDIAKMIADQLEQELVVVDMDFDAVVTSIGKNGVDAGFSGLTITPNRAKVVDFTDPFEEGSYQLILAMADDTTFDNCKSAEEVLEIIKGF